MVVDFGIVIQFLTWQIPIAVLINTSSALPSQRSEHTAYELGCSSIVNNNENTNIEHTIYEKLGGLNNIKTLIQSAAGVHLLGKIIVKVNLT